MTGNVVEHQFWAHKVSGEVWAVRLVDGVVAGSRGPLHHRDCCTRLIEYMYTNEDDAWFAAHDDDFALWEPQPTLA